MDVMWWPLVSLRPQKNECFSVKMRVAGSVIIAFLSLVVALAITALIGETATVDSWVAISLGVVALSVVLVATVAWAWNVRAREENVGDAYEEHNMKNDTVLNWNGVLEIAAKGNPEPVRTVVKSDEEWFEQLGAEAYHVTRKQGTERPHSSEMCRLFEPGRYACVCCDELLFDADEKFDSGTGWPSFTQPADDRAVAYHLDESHGMQRVETVCNVCKAHLGHVFPDGPAPSGLRYCINALALKKIAS